MSLNFNKKELNRLHLGIMKRLESDGQIFLTGTKISGKTALRVCFINHRSIMKDVERL